MSRILSGGTKIAFDDGHVRWYPQAHQLDLGTSIALAGYTNGHFNGWRQCSDIDFEPLQ